MSRFENAVLVLPDARNKFWYIFLVTEDKIYYHQAIPVQDAYWYGLSMLKELAHQHYGYYDYNIPLEGTISDDNIENLFKPVHNWALPLLSEGYMLPLDSHLYKKWAGFLNPLIGKE